MSNVSRRLGALETVTGTRSTWTARDESWFAYLSTPSLPAIVRDFAEGKAQRRWLAEHKRVAGRPGQGGGWYMTVGDGWVWHATEADRERLTRHEVRELEGLLSLGAYDLHQAIELWADEADARGWPMLYGRASGYEQFRERLNRDRQAMDSHRGASGALAVAWRRRYPEWRAGMTAQELDQWEATL